MDNQPAVISGQFTNYKTRKSDKMFVLEICVPAELALATLNTLGTPNPHGGTPVAVALLNEDAAHE